MNSSLQAHRETFWRHCFARFQGRVHAGWSVRFLVLAASIFLLTWFLSFVQKGTAQGEFLNPIWPAAGLSLAGLFFFGRAVWPAVYLPFVVSSLIGGNGWLFSMTAPVGPIACLLLAVWWLDRAGFHPAINDSRDVILLAGAAVGPMALAGFWIAACMVFSGSIPVAAMFSVALVYWAAQATGILVVAPVFFLLAGRWLRNGDHGFTSKLPATFEQEDPTRAASAEAVGMRGNADSGWGTLDSGYQLWSKITAAWDRFGSAVLLTFLWGVTALGFSGVLTGGDGGEMWAYLPFPILVWVALARGVPLTAAGITGAVVIMVSFSMQGKGPFSGGTPLQSFAGAEVFLAIFSVSGLLIAAGAEAKERGTRLREHLLRKDAEMERIKAQIHPHFLFNSLAAIHSLVETDQERAREGIIALSELLRSSLDCAKEKFVPLAEEMKFVENYLVLQKMRFEEGLETDLFWDVELGGFSVFPVLVQPLVENAIKHGEEVGGRKRVSVRVEREEDKVVVRVGNHISTLGDDPPDWKDGTGLGSLRNRLSAGWGEKAAFAIQRTKPDWVVAEIKIPFSLNQ